MGQKSWTKEQSAAISIKDCDLLVAAAAGSGKTAVLVERIVSMITEGENPCDIDRLLIVTFTKAAASEMSERIGLALAEKLKQDPTNVHLQNQLTLLSRADIKTIHAFCLQVIKEYYYLLDMDPSVRTADQSEIKLLKNQVLDEVFEQYYSNEKNQDFCTLVEQFGGGTSDKGLKELVLRIHTFIQGAPDPIDWLKNVTSQYKNVLTGTIDETVWMPIIKKIIHEEVEQSIFQMEQALTIAQCNVGFDGYEKTLEIELEMLKNLTQHISKPFEILYREFSHIKFGRLSPYKGEETELADNIKNLRNHAKKNIGVLKEKYFLFRPETMYDHLKQLQYIVIALVDLIITFSDAYQLAKKEKQILDFSDYEHLCMKILWSNDSTLDEIQPTAAALELQNKYEGILVDEYQDSNLIQEMILTAVSKKSQDNPNCFMVGDVKQSIYRFRLAMPEIFMEKYVNYPLYTKADESKYKKIVLGKNFRSRENILEGINFLFQQIMSKELGELEYNQEAALYPGAIFPETSLLCGGSNEILLIDDSEKEEDFLLEEIQEMNRKEMEAERIAKRIHQLMQDDFNVYDKDIKQYRPLRYSDIAILLRGIRSWNGIFDEIFQKREIPFFMDTSLGYLHTTEVITVLSLLQIIDNPRQDIPLICALHSPIYQFSSEELMEIRLEGGENSYWECLEQYVMKYNDDENDLNKKIVQKIKGFFEHLKNWRESSESFSISELLWYLYYQTGYFDYVGITSGGVARQANLRFLIEKAEQYENTNMKGLFHFVKYIENIKKAEEEEGSAKLLSESDNLVRVMTIHKSKGLEFPVVFVSDMGKEFNMTDTRSDVVMHQKLGLGFNYMDLKNRTVYATLSKTALAEIIKQEMLSEELRVLYVAMTRAKEKLILTGYVKNLQKKLEEWSEVAKTQSLQLPVFYRKKAKNYLDWVMPAFLRHPQSKDICFYERHIFSQVASDWKFECIHSKKFLKEAKNEKDNKINANNYIFTQDLTTDYSGYKNEIFRRLQWKYPFEEATLLQGKISISEIKRRQTLELEKDNTYSLFETKKPIFLQPQFEKKERELTPAEIGTAMHTFMENVDFHGSYDAQGIEEEIEKMKEKNILSIQEANAIDRKAIILFFSSSLAERLKKAKKIEKERPFAMTMRPEELFSDIRYEGMAETILINGIIDCFFYEEDDIILIDYKNDRPTNHAENNLREKYRLQIELYKIALERATGKNVKESYIYSFGLGKSILI